MNINKNKIFAAIAASGLFGSAYIAFDTDSTTSRQAVEITGHGNVTSLNNAFQKWQARYEANGGSPTLLNVPLAYSKAYSRERTTAKGQFKLDLVTGEYVLNVAGLDADEYEVWLIDDKARSEAPDRNVFSDGYVKLGSIGTDNGYGTLKASLSRESLNDFTIDRIAVVPAGSPPSSNEIISGAPSAMQKLYFAGKPWTMAQVGELQSPTQASIPFEFLLPKPAHASNNNQANLAAVLGAEIAEGRRLFTQETFNGNGRTCETCHRLDNNHTIDPKYIAKLPKSDPLFIAETNSALAELENPELMRKLGLFLANIDGFDKPGVMRSVPHLLALSTSIDTELVANGGEFPQDEEFVHALGWSGDGSVGTGSLREFTIGAIVQHFPKTLNREPGIDFRLPTEAELTSMELYQLSLGRSEDPDLSAMTFKSPIVERGKALFDQKENPLDETGKPIFGVSANCNGCHSNAGAVSSSTGGNPTRDTGIEMMKDQPAVLLYPNTPMDGGFGTAEHGDCESPHRSQQDEEAPCNYGDGRFNTPTVIEAADTAPFFHNNSVNTIEEAVAFYNTEAFNNSPGSLTGSGKNRQIKIGSSQIVAIALFLRSLNALENIRASNHLLDQATQLNIANGKEMIKLAMADTEDAIEVLTEGQLIPYPEAIDKLKSAYNIELGASLIPSAAIRNRMLNQAKKLKLEAKAMIVEINAS